MEARKVTHVNELHKTQIHCVMEKQTKPFLVFLL